MKYEITDIVENDLSFTVKLENKETGEERTWTFPNGQEWMKEIDGEKKYIKHLKKKLKEIEEENTGTKEREKHKGKKLEI